MMVYVFSFLLISIEVPTNIYPERIDVEEGLMVAILESLNAVKDNPTEITEYLDTLYSIFSIDYLELQRVFFQHQGILQLEELIKKYASNSIIVRKIIVIFTCMAKNNHFSQELEKSNITAIAIQILLRFPDDHTMIKNALSIIRCLCVYCIY